MATIKDRLKSIRGRSSGRKHITDRNTEIIRQKKKRNTEIQEDIKGTENDKYVGKYKGKYIDYI